MGNNPKEKDAVRTTIVGGRPPGSGREQSPHVPRGIEVLVMKASVDPEFRKLLLEKRRGAAEFIGLKLEPAEADMLAAIPAEQLEAIIDNTKVPEKNRRAFLSKSVETMLAVAVVGVATAAVVPAFLRSQGKSRGIASNCRDNRYRIEVAKHEWAKEHNKAAGAPVEWNDLIGAFMRSAPVCPKDGRYVLNSVGEPVVCTACSRPVEKVR